MGFLSRLIDGAANHKDVLLHAPEPDGIGYDAELVDRLKDEHQELLRVFTAIKTTAANKHFHQLPNLLYKLEVVFQRHITLENAKFYAYVEQRCASDYITSRFVSSVHAEMDDIVYTLDRFVNTHLTSLPTPSTVAQFNVELDRISSLLTWRLQFEESSLFYFYQGNE